MKTLYVLAVLSLAAAAACKGEDVAATVNCTVVAGSPGPALECKIQQTKGKSEIEVCWDFKLTCGNGGTLEAIKSCGKVKDGQGADLTIPFEELKIEGGCEGEKNAVVTNMKIEGV